MERDAPRPSGRRPQIAAIVVGYQIRWHADNIVTRLLEGYWINQTWHEPRCQIASVYVHERGPADVSRRLAAAYDFALAPTIDEALTLGTGGLAVDGVVVVTESPSDAVAFADHPYRQFFEEIVRTFHRTGRVVPLFNDKQLAAHWSDSLWMYEQSRELGFPVLAGSVIPATFRRPALDFAVDTPITDAVVVASIPLQYVESIGFHAIEFLQSLVERRPGGESGIRRVEFLEGDAVWRARDAGRWSRELFDAAVARSLTRTPGRPEDLASEPLAVLLEYRDGFKAAIVGVSGFVADVTAAVQLGDDGGQLSTLAYYVTENGNSFSCLVEQIEDLMLSGHAAVPVERTLLSSGVIDFMLRSRRAGLPIDTPELAVAYPAPEQSVYCPGPGS